MVGSDHSELFGEPFDQRPPSTTDATESREQQQRRSAPELLVGNVDAIDVDDLHGLSVLPMSALDAGHSTVSAPEAARGDIGVVACSRRTPERYCGIRAHQERWRDRPCEAAATVEDGANA